MCGTATVKVACSIQHTVSADFKQLFTMIVEKHNKRYWRQYPLCLCVQRNVWVLEESSYEWLVAVLCVEPPDTSCSEIPVSTLPTRVFPGPWAGVSPLYDELLSKRLEPLVRACNGCGEKVPQLLILKNHSGKKILPFLVRR